jgi:predicted RNase H-like HicB family nuclease
MENGDVWEHRGRVKGSGGRDANFLPTYQCLRREGALALRGQECNLQVMRNEFTAIIEKDGKWFIAYCPEVPGANGQGRTAQAAKESLTEAIKLILAERRRDARRGLPQGARRELLTVA